MKKIINKIFLTALLLASSVSFAQGMNKASLLNELNKTYGITLSTEEKTYFENANGALVLELVGLEQKNLSKENRNKEIDTLFDKRDKALTSSLGINKYSDIKSKSDAKTAETIQKIRVAKITP